MRINLQKYALKINLNLTHKPPTFARITMTSISQNKDEITFPSEAQDSDYETGHPNPNP